jgi:hypothetical protein
MNDTLTTFKERHEATDALLKDEYNKVSDRSHLAQSVIYSKIGNNLDVTGQTVGNYINGEGKDGYLKDAILRELKNFK